MGKSIDFSSEEVNDFCRGQVVRDWSAKRMLAKRRLLLNLRQRDIVHGRKQLGAGAGRRNKRVFAAQSQIEEGTVQERAGGNLRTRAAAGHAKATAFQGHCLARIQPQVSEKPNVYNFAQDPPSML